MFNIIWHNKKQDYKTNRTTVKVLVLLFKPRNVASIVPLCVYLK